MNGIMYLEDPVDKASLCSVHFYAWLCRFFLVNGQCI